MMGDNWKGVLRRERISLMDKKRFATTVSMIMLLMIFLTGCSLFKKEPTEAELIQYRNKDIMNCDMIYTVFKDCLSDNARKEAAEKSGIIKFKSGKDINIPDMPELEKDLKESLNKTEEPKYPGATCYIIEWEAENGYISNVKVYTDAPD